MRPKENVSSSFHLSDLRNNTSENTAVHETRSNLTEVKTVSLASTVHLLLVHWFRRCRYLGGPSTSRLRHIYRFNICHSLSAGAVDFVCLHLISKSRGVSHVLLFIYHFCGNVGVYEALSTRVVVYRIFRCESCTSIGRHFGRPWPVFSETFYHSCAFQICPNSAITITWWYA